jgi:cation diffusion facilitator CzcD-associated flavoprotein CzcO
LATIEADYLVIGAGAMAMAFVDMLVDETDARVVMVDRNHSPGGHWFSAYPFVRLHQPSAYYGVNSRRLGSETIDSTGLNKGYYELAGGAEVCAYFDAVMHQQLLPTGQVTAPSAATTSTWRPERSSTRRSSGSRCRRCGALRRRSRGRLHSTPTTCPATRPAIAT